MGIVSLADHFATRQVEQGLLVKVLPEWALPQVSIWCITPGRRLLPLRTLAFIDMLKSVLGT
jgi:DNA-binding transcriptional LysR family regulator